MDPNDFRRRLLAERARLLAQAREYRDRGLGESLRESTEELSGYDNHPADLGSETWEREKDLGRRLDQRVELDRVEDALSRIEAGRYGNCQRCGRPIGEDRLRALPYAELCLDCQRESEDNPAAGSGRPVEEAVLYPPFGRSNRDGTEHPGVDGEDVYESVERFGSSITPQDTLGAHDYKDLSGGGDDDGSVQPVEDVVDEKGEPVRHHWQVE